MEVWQRRRGFINAGREEVIESISLRLGKGERLAMDTALSMFPLQVFRRLHKCKIVLHPHVVLELMDRLG